MSDSATTGPPTDTTTHDDDPLARCDSVPILQPIADAVTGTAPIPTVGPLSDALGTTLTSAMARTLPAGVAGPLSCAIPVALTARHRSPMSLAVADALTQMRHLSAAADGREEDEASRPRLLPRPLMKELLDQMVARLAGGRALAAGYAAHDILRGADILRVPMGDVIADRYEVLGRLGEGVLGEVVKVRDRTDGSLRAVKLLKMRASEGSTLGRFEREFQAISRIRHPNIVEVFDFGVHDDRPYFTMELLEGLDLGAWHAEMRPAADAPGFDEYVAQVAYIFHQIADALALVHASSLVHRDLKPENIFVRPGRHPRAKLLDFGHARDHEANGENLTVTGTVLGTASYMPPEQAMGQKVTAPADLYSLGCVLFEALTGREPFAGKTVVEVLLGHIQRPPPDACVLDGRVPAGLGDLCRELLAKEPDARPASAAAVAERLARF